MPISRARELILGIEPGTYERTSDETDQYNCLAWVFGITDQWLWPGSEFAAWPDDLQLGDELEAIVEFAERQGFEACEAGDLESGFARLAIYQRDDSAEVTHVALQLPDGRWSSKLGAWEDIAHETPQAVGRRYGVAKTFMRRAHAGEDPEAG